MPTPQVLHLVDRLEGGGSEHTLLNLLNAFDPARFDHRLITLRRAGRLTARLSDAIPCKPLNIVGRDRWAGRLIARCVDGRAAVVIHARNTGCWFDALVAAVLRPRARVVLGFHGLDRGGGLTLRQRRLAGWGCRLGAEFLTVSTSGKDQLHRQAGAPQARLTVIPNGVLLDRFCPPRPPDRADARQRFGFATDDVVIGSVAALKPVKDHAALLDATAALLHAGYPVRTLIIGRGPLEGALRAQADRLGIAGRVVFAGWCDDVASALSAMDLYACASQSEAMSNSVLEALACGLPVVATDVGDNARVVRDGREGRIVPPRDGTALTRALEACVRDGQVRRELGAAARRRAGEFPFASTVRAYETYYESLIAGHRPGQVAIPGAAAVMVQ